MVPLAYTVLPTPRTDRGSVWSTVVRGCVLHVANFPGGSHHTKYVNIGFFGLHINYVETIGVYCISYKIRENHLFRGCHINSWRKSLFTGFSYGIRENRSFSGPWSGVWGGQIGRLFSRQLLG